MEQEILSCLQALAAGEQGGAGTAGGSSSAAIDAPALPTPWLLLDLETMLPEGSPLRPTDPEAQRALSTKICQAGGDGRRALVVVWQLSREIAQHSAVLEQLAAYLLDSPAALGLVLSGLRWRGGAAGAAAAEAAAVAEQLAAAAWRRWRANTLPLVWGATKPHDLAAEEQHAQEGLVAATQLMRCSWELTGSGAPLLAVLQQYGDHLLLMVHKLLELHAQLAQRGSITTHDSGGCAAGSGTGSHVGTSAAKQHQLDTWVWWWAANACWLVSQHGSGAGTVLRASLELVSLALHTTLAAACGSHCLSLQQLQPGGPLDYMANLLVGLLLWAKRGRALRKGALDLLHRHGVALLCALSELLAAPADGPLQLLRQQAEVGSGNQGAAEHLEQLNAACELYIGCVWHMLACLRLPGVLQQAGLLQEQASRAAALLQATARDGSRFQHWLSHQCALELASTCRGAMSFFEDLVVRYSEQHRSSNQGAGGGGVVGRLTGTIGRALGFGGTGGRGRR